MAVYFKNSYKSDGAALPLSVKNVGFQQCTPGYRWGAGVRDHYLIHYVVSGRGTFTAAGRAFPVRAGEVFLVWPNVVVSYEADTESPWEYYWLGFSGPDAAALLARTDLRPDAPVLHIDFGRTFQRYITSIYEARGQSAWSRTQMLGYAYLLLGKLIEGRESPEDRGDVIDRAAAYIENNYAEPITVDDIASFAGVSRSWLYRGFMQRFGRSPTALLRETRLKTARTLLRGTTMHISEIAWSVGYPDALYFSRVFAASEGCSPSVYRAERRTPQGSAPQLYSPDSE